MIRPVQPAIQRELDAAKREHKQRNYAAARLRYQNILQRDPTFAQALHYLGVLEHMDGNSELGLSLLQRALQQFPNDYDLRKNLANVLSETQRSDEATQMYLNLIAEHPDDAGNHANLAVVLRKRGQHAEAIASAKRGVALAPSSPIVWLALANAQADAGELNDATHAYEKVIALNSNFSSAHDSLCRTLLQIEQAGLLSRFRLRRTRAAYRRWLTAVPGHPTASFMLEALEAKTTPARMPDASVQSSFDAYAEDFDKHIRTLDYRAPELIGEVLARRLPPAQGNLDILDGGCGTGLAAPLLRPYTKRLTGIDLSSAMLARARASGNYDELQQAELGAFLDAHAEAFDVCVLVDVLTYFGDLHAIVASAAQSLRPGGLLAFTVEKSNRAGSHLHPTGRYSHHAEHVRSALRAADMRNVEISEATIRNEGNAPVIGLICSGERVG